MTKGKSEDHIWVLPVNRYVSFLFRDNRTIFDWEPVQEHKVTPRYTGVN